MVRCIGGMRVFVPLSIHMKTQDQRRWDKGLCLSLEMNWQRIAVCFGISRRTLYRHRQQPEIGPLTYTGMSDEVLTDIVTEILQTTPNADERHVLGGLRSRNIRTQCWRVRHCLQHLDPVGRAFRCGHSIRWRIYLLILQFHNSNEICKEHILVLLKYYSPWLQFCF